MAQTYKKQARFTITSVARTLSDSLSAFLRPDSRFRHLSPHQPLKNAPDDFCVPAWLCTQVNEVRFQSAITIKPGKSRMTKQESVNMAKFIRAQSLLL
ncbi:Rop family plasmid primer RNA-binding protein, partial [Enterobacter kobei]|uniref:Rop family plasmid primer RNA-binding protein n=1 Tax=Enterobacter kobei TaxID=208224 RepID=UPI001EE75015